MTTMLMLLEVTLQVRKGMRTDALPQLFCCIHVPAQNDFVKPVAMKILRATFAHHLKSNFTYITPVLCDDVK